MVSEITRNVLRHAGRERLTIIIIYTINLYTNVQQRFFMRRILIASFFYGLIFCDKNFIVIIHCKLQVLDFKLHLIQMQFMQVCASLN